MKEKIYITGHKNPDTDSIASVLVYADLKKQIDPENEYIPVRLGELNLESKWVLEKWNYEAPKLVETLKQRVEDLNLVKPLCITEDVSLYVAANYLQPRNRTFLPVVGNGDVLKGVVTLSNLTKNYMDVWDDEVLGKSNTSIDNIVETVAGEIVHLPENPNEFNGRMLVYASLVDEEGHVSKGDILIVGNREDAQLEAIERKVGVLLISSGHKISDELLKKAVENNVTVITTKYNSFMAARLIPQAVPVSYVMSKENLEYFTPDEFLENVSRKVKNSRIRNFPIVNDNLQVIGQLNRNDLLFDKKKQVILVDHNESNQSIDDREQVEIREIIDHHRVANISTNGPIYFRNEPVGCTSTILGMMYKEHGIKPSKEIAGLMASAIISDTLLFRSPTTTDTDRRILLELAEIAEINLEEYAQEMFDAGTSLEGVSAKDILLMDSKKFEIEGKIARVSQAFTTNLASLEKMKEDILDIMKSTQNSEKTDMFALFVTDIFNEKSIVYTVGSYTGHLAHEFGAEFDPKGYEVKGLLSRKKQFIPSLTKAISNALKEE